MVNKHNIKEILINKLEGIKHVKPSTSRFDDVRDFLSNEYDFRTLVETVWNILNNFPNITCLECGNIPRFHSYTIGYKQFCNVKCSNRYKGKDPEISKRISASVSKHHSEVTGDFWEERAKVYRNTVDNQTDEYKNIKKINKSNRMKLVHRNRCSEQKNTINIKISESLKNSDIARIQRIKRSKLGAQALQKKRRRMTADELKEFNKRFGSKDEIGTRREDYKQYLKLVNYYTNKDLSLLENIHLRGLDYHLDHKYSRKQGFLDNISPEIIGNNINLEIITATMNLVKGSGCSISKEDLISSFNELKIGDF